jgi:predicted aminopeptidase
LNDPQLRDSYREKLVLTNDIRRFAMDSLGLKNSDNYTTFYDHQGQPLMWVVTGCLPYELKAKEWWFPLIGHVSYKGFFNEQLARREELQVRRAGYETDIYNPSAWSTLGYFTDPILSNQLKRGPGRLAELIIHELTHATVYLESSVDFNENLATFIGEQGASAFLKSKFGADAEETKRYTDFLADQSLYSEAMMLGAQRLDSLYRTMDHNLPVKEKALLKYRLISDILVHINRLPFARPEQFRFHFGKDPLPGNTEFMSFLRYRKQQGDFELELSGKYKGDLRAMIAAYATASR